LRPGLPGGALRSVAGPPGPLQRSGAGRPAFHGGGGPLMTRGLVLRAAVMAITAVGVVAMVHRPSGDRRDLPNRIPEAAFYVTVEAQVFPPPYEEYWQAQNHPGQCQTCHQKIFD